MDLVDQENEEVLSLFLSKLSLFIDKIKLSDEIEKIIPVLEKLCYIDYRDSGEKS